jgi:hypothetical protein
MFALPNFSMSKGFFLSIILVLFVVAPMVERIGTVTSVLGGFAAPRRPVAPRPPSTPRPPLPQKPPKRKPAVTTAASTDYQVPAGTVVAVTLGNTVRSATSSTGDQVDAKLTAAIVRDGVELIPPGSVLHGSVVDALAASPLELRGRIAIAFFVIEHAVTGSRASIKTRTITVDAPPPVDKPRADKQPADVELIAGQALNLVLTEPLLIRIPK